MILRRLQPVLLHSKGATLELQGVFRVPLNERLGRLCSTTSGTKVADNDSTAKGTCGVSVTYARGLPQFVIPLPSRRERCLFSMRPVSNNVGHLIQQIRDEDHGIDRVALRTTDGVRIAASNSIESLMEHEHFDLLINDVVYRVVSPPRERISKEEMERLSDVQNLVMQLYEALHVKEHHEKKQRQMLTQLENLQAQLLPLEEKKSKLVADAEKRTDMLTWGGLCLMGVQFGALARLTWWEYSWDIMEPVTYFVTYGTSIAIFAYYTLTKQEYLLNDARDREFLLHFHKKAKKVGMDIDKYNELKNSVAEMENNLERLRDPLRIHSASSPAVQPTQQTASLWNKTQFRLSTLMGKSKE